MPDTPLPPMKPEYAMALRALKHITFSRREEDTDCRCVRCANRAVEVRLTLTAENFNELREALFGFPEW
jgi:hypothetical protein